MVNIMLSLFTPAKAFAMTDDDIYARYKEGKTAAIMDMGEGCWAWMTDSKMLAREDRPRAMIELLTREKAEEMDDIFVDALKGSEKMLVQPGSDWSDIYDEYLRKMKEEMKKKYAQVIPEEETARAVHAEIVRKFEWATMEHQNRTSPPYHLLTKNVLPMMADQLKRVERSITEVSVYRVCIVSYGVGMPADGHVLMRGCHGARGWAHPYTRGSCFSYPDTAHNGMLMRGTKTPRIRAYRHAHQGLFMRAYHDHPIFKTSFSSLLTTALVGSSMVGSPRRTSVGTGKGFQ